MEALNQLSGWLENDWRGLLPMPWAHLSMTLAAVICGAIVGLEREKREKPAGLRTIVLVCLGSTTFTMTSFAFGTTTGDTGRVAAQIVTGIGFLGAGVILHGKTAVTGLTTAATIWATAAMGIVIGVGYVAAGVGLSLLIRLVLTGFVRWELYAAGDLPGSTVEFEIDPAHGKTRLRLERLMENFQIRSGLQALGEQPDGLVRCRLHFELPRKHRAEFLDELSRFPEVRKILEVT